MEPFPQGTLDRSTKKNLSPVIGERAVVAGT